MVRPLQSVSSLDIPSIFAVHLRNDLDRLAPKYDELGLLYQSNPDFASKVTIAKVDATANDVPDEIQGFPTIKLFPAGNKSDPVSYSGSRTVEDLVQFIKENGKHGVDAYEGKAPSEQAEPEEELGEQAPAATEKIKSKVSSVVEAVKTAVADTDDQAGDRDEL